MPRKAKNNSIAATTEPVVDLLAYQRAAVTCPARFTHNNWSRQTGKSFTFGLRRLLRGIERRRLQVLLSAGERQSRELMLKVRQHCQALQIANELRDDTFFEGSSFKQLELTLPNGVRVIALPANPMTARGFTGDALLDEFAMHKDDREIWAALLPTVTRGSGELDICSTPCGKGNTFYKLSLNDQFERTTLSIHDAIRDGLQVDAEALRKATGDEEIWRQEFMCEYLDESTAFLTYEMIAAISSQHVPPPIRCTGDNAAARTIVGLLETLAGSRAHGSLAGPPDLASPPDVARFAVAKFAVANASGSEKQAPAELYAGIDIGRKSDLTVIWILERVGPALRTRAVLELRSMPFRNQYEVIRDVLGLNGMRRAAIDATGLGMQIAETAQEHYGPWKADAVTFSVAVKQKLAGQLLIRAQDRSIEIPLDEKIREDFHAIDKVVTTGGSVLYRAERNRDGHSDRFWACALAVDAAVGTPQGIGCRVL